MQTDSLGEGEDSDNTSGVNKTEEKQKARRESESQPGREVGSIVREENRTSDAFKVKGKHVELLLHLQSKHQN